MNMVSQLPARDGLDALEAKTIAATRWIAFAGVLVMLLLAFGVTLDVLARWLFNKPIHGLNEAVSMGIAVAVAATFPAGAAQRVNLTIDLLDGRIAARTLNWLKIAAAVLLLLFYVLLSWRVGHYAQTLQARGATTIFLLMPTAPFVWAVAAFMGLSALVQALAVVSATRFALAGAPIPAGWDIGGGDVVKAQPRERPSAARTFVAGALALALGAAVVALFIWSLGDIGAYARREPLAFSLLLIGALWALLILCVPLAVVMGLLGLVAAVAFTGIEPALSVLGNESVQFLTNYEVAVLPMFLLMGSFAVVAGMSSDIYAFAHTLLASRRGGLALATVGGCAGFGALTGSSLATVATIGRVAMPEMSARGYSKGLAAGSVAAGGTLGALVPPSIPLVFYALLTESSIGQLFVAAVVPAIVAIAFYLAAIAIYVRLRPEAAPAAQARSSLRDVLAAGKKAWS
ncbi:MAG: TRAP-type C4-dicarboxylate transport system, large permease component, partial [Hyphomicrobiales bacterium]|nr:TRAP-type C4-dicarboxylate transport system, large permease component [Hyphomicrobiales bacterium]